MKRKILAGLLTLCMAAGMAVPAAAATTPAEQEQGAEGPKYTLQDHVLNEANNWDISDELIMPARASLFNISLTRYSGIAVVLRRTISIGSM